MCLATGGTFINSPNSESLKVAFQAITNLKDATDQQSNYIDEKFDWSLLAALSMKVCENMSLLLYSTI